MFDKAGVFAGSSFYNQNRLHKGFHYSRNKRTRQLCSNTFDRFIKDYSHLVDDIPNNLYVIPKDRSLIDFETYKSIFEYDNISFSETEAGFLNNVEGCIAVDEKYINPYKSKEYFESSLSKNLEIKDITPSDIEDLSKKFDLVVNLTNNRLNAISDHYYELSLILVYKKITDGNFGSITMVDGPLFSIYPYKDDYYTVTDVEYTPLYTSDDICELEDFQAQIGRGFIDTVKDKIERKILFYYQGFKDCFQYEKYYTSIKVKRRSDSADRYPSIVRKNNIVSAATGKIQGIYILEDYFHEITNR